MESNSKPNARIVSLTRVFRFDVRDEMMKIPDVNDRPKEFAHPLAEQFRKAGFRAHMIQSFSDPDADDEHWHRIEVKVEIPDDSLWVLRTRAGRLD